ncbi:MAG TPA: SH3 domain-containing protein [Ruminococcus sp.]|nr:SH3 domain-containing protein [Ruminococcus sp.]
MIIKVGARGHKIESYEEIFTSYLAEDDAYFAAIGDEEHYDLPMINYLLDDDSERINTVIEGMEAANDIVEDYSDYDISSEDLKMIKSSAALGKQLDYAIKLYSFAAIYTDHVTDHYEMLDAIYGLDFSKIENNKIGITEESYSAAKKVYEMYSDDQKQAIANYIGKQIENKVKDMIEDGIKDGISEELALGHAFAWSKLAASVMKAYFIATDFPVYNVSRKCENLRYYNKLMERGVNQFWAYNNAYNNISKDNIEKARLSAIFALLSSRSMYQALLDSEKAYGHTGAVYQRKIDSINEALKKMYLAKNCCLTDSEEYINERIKLLNSSMNSLDFTDSTDTEMYYAFDSTILAALSKSFKNDDIEDKYMVNDLDNDGKLELAVYTGISKESGRGSCILFENTNNPGIFSFTATGAAGYCGFVYDTESRKILFNNNWSSIGNRKIEFSEWNGQEWSLISLFYDGLGENGTRDISDCYWNNENLSEEEFMQLSNAIQDNWANSEYIFNNTVNGSLDAVTEAFEDYLSSFYETNPVVSYMNNGVSTNIITVKKLTYRWTDNIVLLNAWGDEDFDLLRKLETTCFILDETSDGIRIRCQNFGDNIDFSVEQQNLIAYKNSLPYKVSVLSDDSSFNKDVVILSDTNSTISKYAVGELSKIQFSLDAKTRAHEGLVLREGPSTQTKQLDLIPYGTSIKVISLKNGFKHGMIDDSMVKVEYNGKTGYVYPGYLLIDNTFDLNNSSIEQKYAIGLLLYNQYTQLWFDFWHNGGISDCTVTDDKYNAEYDINGTKSYMGYNKLEPKGLTIASLKSDYNSYFSSNVYNPGFEERVYIEKDGYLWQSTGYGGDPSWDYDEVLEITSDSNNRIVYKVRHQLLPEFYASQGYEFREEAFAIVLEDGRWKCDEISPHT